MSISKVTVKVPVSTGTTPPSEFATNAANSAAQALTYKNQAYASEVAALQAVQDCLAAESALQNLDNFKPQGVLDCSTNPNFPAGTEGDYYIVSVAGKVGGASGVEVRVGDMVLCTAPAASGDFATVGTKWVHVVTNLDGVVIGPTLSVVDNIATYNATNGKLIKDSGVALSSLARTADLGTLAAISHPNDSTKMLQGDGTFVDKPAAGATINDILPYIIALG